MFLLPAKMKKIRSKLKVLVSSVHNIIHQFSRRSEADNAGICDCIWLKLELIQALMHVRITCKKEEDSIKNEGARVNTTFSHYKSMGIFPYAQGQLTPQTLVRSCRISNSFEIL